MQMGICIDKKYTQLQIQLPLHENLGFKIWILACIFSFLCSPNANINLAHMTEQELLQL